MAPRKIGSNRLKQIRLAEGRWRHNLARRRLKADFHREATKSPVADEVIYRSKILDKLSQEKYVPVNERPKGSVVRLNIPEIFSFTKNPVGTIATIRTLVKSVRSSRVPRVVIDHRKVIDMGLGADTVLGLVLNEIQREASSSRRAYIRGYKPANLSIRKMMEDVGSVRALNDFEDKVEIDLKSSDKVYRFHNRHKSGTYNPLEQDVVSRTVQRSADHLNACLGLVGKELSDSGLQGLLEYFSEVLSNAEEHSGTREWAAVGYIDSDDEALVYRCVIVSFGQTIAENFQVLPRESYAWDCVLPYLEDHRKKGLFGKDWKEDTLLSVVALQGDISSANCSKEDTRGQGTVDLIEFFQDVHDECDPQNKFKSGMHIMSGFTIIRFDGTYHMKKDASGRKVIAFNEENSLSELPDRRYVEQLVREKFPGVVISVSVPLGGAEITDVQ